MRSNIQTDSTRPTPFLAVALILFISLGGCSSDRNSGSSGEGRTVAGAEQPIAVLPEEADSSAEPRQTRTEDIANRVVAGEARVKLAQSHEQLATAQVLPAPVPPYRHPGVVREPENRENYQNFDDNPVHLVSEDPVSTFSIDVDTASYSNVRRLLNQGLLPQTDAVRVEELINYFSYRYPVPEAADVPFSLSTEMGPSPWHPDRKLLHIGIQGYQPPADQLPAANLVFLIDVSGSMRSPDKLELLKASMKLLVSQLDADDHVAIAVYAGAAGTVLAPTPGSERTRILSAIDQLTAGGSTNGGAGIRLAYSLAAQNYQPGGINRVILATDGDFNVGTTNQQALKDLVEQQRRSGVALSVLGFGTGNYNDALMQELSQIGNGNAAYIDTMNEARKVLVDELAQTLNIIAQDVKIQVEFNPAVVAEYRLIGYETRHLNREDFNNDKVDAGDIGAGHTVTALYELALADSTGTLMDPLRYQSRERATPVPADAELGFLKLRYKQPGAHSSALISQPLLRTDIAASLNDTSANYRFSAAVAAFGQLLRGGSYLNDFDFDAARALAVSARGEDPFGYRGEFLALLRTAEVLTASTTHAEPDATEEAVASYR